MNIYNNILYLKLKVSKYTQVCNKVSKLFFLFYVLLYNLKNQLRYIMGLKMVICILIVFQMVRLTLHRHSYKWLA